MLNTARLQTIVCTARMAEATRFYEDVLGLSCTGVSLGVRVFHVGGAELRLSPVPTLTPSEHTVVGFAVTDLAEAVAMLTARGVRLERFTNFPQDARGVLRMPDGTQVAWFRDPDGNLLSVVQYA
jgi:catechol 2,3-dioxygenase-like lactoylglutathione lyase family enzyme